MEALISLIKDQFINCKVGKIWDLREGLEWLAGLLNTALSCSQRYPVHVLTLTFRHLIVCLRCDHIQKVLIKRTWPGRSNWGTGFFNKQGRPKGLSSGGYHTTKTARIFTTLSGFIALEVT
jgi:hypothetical protein